MRLLNDWHRQVLEDSGSSDAVLVSFASVSCFRMEPQKKLLLSLKTKILPFSEGGMGLGK